MKKLVWESNLVDVHAHLAPINASRINELSGVSWTPETQELSLDGAVVGFKDLFFPERLLQWMDEHNVARALVSIPPPLYRQTLSPKASLEWVNYANEALLETCQRYTERLSTLFYFPLEHVSLHDELMERYLRGGYHGAVLSAGGHPDIIYSRTDYEPLWQFLNRQRAFVFIHPGQCSDPRLAGFYLENLLGNPYETAVAAVHLMMVDVPRRYSDIRFCLAHAGGVLPCLCGRLDRGFITARPGVDVDNVELPSKAIRRFFADGIAHNEAGLELAQEVFGADHILFGSDWPFPMGLRDPQSKKK